MVEWARPFSLMMAIFRAGIFNATNFYQTVVPTALSMAQGAGRMISDSGLPISDIRFKKMGNGVRVKEKAQGTGLAF